MDSRADGRNAFALARVLRAWMCCALAAFACMLLTPAASAQNATWLANPGSQDFNDGLNWSGGVPPSGTAFFGNSAVFDLTTSADATIGGFTFNLGAGTYTLLNSHVLEFTGAGLLINAGSFTLTNDFTVTFSGSSSAGTATIINNCCLHFTNSSTAGFATITNNNNLDFADTSTAGNAAITNNGSVSFFDASTAGRATIINNGMMEFFDATSADRANITNTALLMFHNSAGAGTATIINAGLLGFENSATAGSATITNTNAGGIIFFGNSIAGSAVIYNNGSITFLDSSSAANATIFNTCCLAFAATSTAGNATIVTENGGLTFLTDAASGGTARFVINTGGTLDISNLGVAATTVGSIEGAGSIILGDRQLVIGGRNISTLFSGVIEGVGGSLVKEGSGVLTLTGISTYTGPTTVIGGMLIVNGSIVSSVTVEAGGALGGTGEVGGLAVNAGGIHAPGNSIGSQIVNGNYVNAGTLVIEANSAGQADRIIVNGTVDITGATLNVIAGGVFGPATQYLIIQNNSANPVSGAFASLISNLAFLTPSVITTGGDGNDVVLTLTRNDVQLSQVALTPNQKAVAGGLQAGFQSNAGSDGALVINSLLMLPAEAARAAFDAMSGEIHASIAHVFFSQSRQVMGLASDRLWDGWSSGMSGGAMRLADAGSLGTGLAPGQAHDRMALGAGPRESAGEVRPSRISTWARGFGETARLDADGNAERLASRTGGFVMGGDVPVGRGFLIGVMGGWTTTGADVERRSSTAEIEAGHAAAYARLSLGDIVLNGIAGYSHYEIDVTRGVAFAGLSRTAQSSYSAGQATLYGEAGWRIRAGSLSLMPLAALRWSHVDVDGFVETGAGSVNLASDGATFTMLDAIAGVRIGSAFTAYGATWLPQARAAWTHSFGDTDPRLDLAFEGGGSFVVRGVERERDAFTLGAGLNVTRGEDAFGFLDYATRLSEGAQDHAVTGGLRVRY